MIYTRNTAVQECSLVLASVPTQTISVMLTLLIVENINVLKMQSFMKIHQLIEKLARRRGRPQTLLKEGSGLES